MEDWFDVIAEYAVANGGAMRPGGRVYMWVSAGDLEGLEDVLPDSVVTREGHMAWRRVQDWLVMHPGGEAWVQFKREGTIAALQLRARFDAVPTVSGSGEGGVGAHLVERMFGASLAVGTGKACKYSPELRLVG